MKTVTTQRLIGAPPDHVWAHLTDAQALVRAETGIRRLEGPLIPHGELRLEADIAPGRVFKVVVADCAPYRMVWQSGLPLGLFRGTRTFVLTPEGAQTRFAMTERFTGLLLPLIWRSMPDLQPSFETFAAGLAAACERTAP